MSESAGFLILQDKDLKNSPLRRGSLRLREFYRPFHNQILEFPNIFWQNLKLSQCATNVQILTYSNALWMADELRIYSAALMDDSRAPFQGRDEILIFKAMLFGGFG